MVAKQTKNRRASPPKPKTDPIERARAEVAKDSGALDPALVALVAEWSGLRTALNDPAKPPQADDAEGFARLSHLHRAIYLFPAGSAADLCAKLPALRDELQHLADESPEGSAALGLTAWRGVIADLERLSGATASHASTPQDAANIEFEPRTDLAPFNGDEWDILCEAHVDAVLTAFDILGQSKPELMQWWGAEQAASGAAVAIERARNWLAETTGVLDEALARLLVAGAAARLVADDAPSDEVAA